MIQERSTETEEVGGASGSSGGGGVRVTDEGKLGYGSGTWRGGACASGVSMKTRTRKINNQEGSGGAAGEWRGA
jgi:hypothetical protein